MTARGLHSIAAVLLWVCAYGCASTSYQQREVGEVNKKVDEVALELEKTQQRTAQAVDQFESRTKALEDQLQALRRSVESASRPPIPPPPLVPSDTTSGQSGTSVKSATRPRTRLAPTPSPTPSAAVTVTDQLEERVKHAPLGEVRWQCSRQMVVKQSETVEVSVATPEMFRAGHGVPDGSESWQVADEKVPLPTDFNIVATLSGADFTVVPNGEQQPETVRSDRGFSWKWQVIPLTEGDKLLFVKIQLRGPNYAETFNNEPVEIKVRVKVWDRVKAVVLMPSSWVLSILSAAVGAKASSRLGKKRQKR